MAIRIHLARVRGVVVIVSLGLACGVTARATAQSAPTRPALAPPHPARAAVRHATDFIQGTWELLTLSTRWPDGRVTAPWGDHPIGRIIYDGDGRMTTLLMDGGRNQADGRAVPPDIQARVAGYYGTYTVDTARRVVTHHVAASLRATEAGSIERRYELRGDTLILTAKAMFEGAPVTHTLAWRRVADSARR